VSNRLDKCQAELASRAGLSSTRVARYMGWLHRTAFGMYGAISRRVLPRGYALPALHYFIEVTGRCNLRCGMCQFAESLRPVTDLQDAEDELTVTEWRRIIDQTNRYAVVSFTGGEPWVRTDFGAILTHAAGKRRVHFISNGTRLNHQAVELIVGLAPKRAGAVGLNAVGISVHGLSGTHDAIVGRIGAFDEAVGAIHAITTRRTLTGKTCPIVHATCVVQEDHVSELDQLPAILAASGADVLNLALESHQAELPDFGAVHPSDYAANVLRRPHIDGDRLRLALTRVVDNATRAGIEVRLPDVPLEHVVDYYDQGMTLDSYLCRSAWTTMTIDRRGGAYPCLFYRVGTTSKETLSAIWNGTKMREFRRTLGHRVYPACAGCCNLEHTGHVFNGGKADKS